MLKKIGLYVFVAVVAGVLGISLGGVYTKSRQSACPPAGNCTQEVGFGPRVGNALPVGRY